ncbi:glycosyltransferase [soil metagenome]
MKILHVSTPVTWRGGEQQLLSLATVLKDYPVTQWVMCPEKSQLINKLNAVEVAVIPYRNKGLLSLKLSWKIAMSCKKFRIQIIHTHDAHAHTAAVLSCFLFRNQAKIIVSRRVDFPIKNSFLSRWKYNFKSVKSVICVSELIKKIVEPSINFHERIRVVYDGIDLNKYRKFNSKISGLRKDYSSDCSSIFIGNVSALADHKDYTSFIATCKKLLNDGMQAHFFIVGDGPLQNNIKTQVLNSDCGKSITMTGFRNDIPDVLSSLDLLLITSKTEGLGSVILEAMAAGTPVVSTNAGGIPEIVQMNETGLLADISDSENLAIQVHRIFEEPGLKEKLIKNALSFVQGFSIERTAYLTFSIYLEQIDIEAFINQIM